MRVLFFYKYLTLGGCETVLRARLDGLPAHGIEADAWFLTDLGGRSVFSGIEERIHVGGVDALLASVASGRWDVVSTLDSEEVFPPYRSASPPTPLVVEVHTPYRDSQRYLEHLAGVAISAFAAPSQFQAGVVRARAGKDVGVTVLPNPLRLPFVAEPVPFDPRPPRPVVAWVGRLDALKNWTGFVDVAAEVVRQRPGTEAWIVGADPEPSVAEELRRRAGAAGLLPHLRWFSGLPHDVVPRFLDAVRDSGGLLISTSKGESFGMGVAEAMARECPVVVPRYGPFPEFVTDGVTGRLHPPDDMHSAAAAVCSLLDDAEARRRLGEAARSSVLERFAPGPAVAECARFLCEVVSESAGRPGDGESVRPPSRPVPPAAS